MSRGRVRAGALAALFLVGGVAVADRLHLEGGGTIDTDSWWMDGDVLRYETAGGTMGIPRSVVVRIEEGEFDTRKTPAPRPRSTPPADRAPARPPARSELHRLMREATDSLRERNYETASALFQKVLGETSDIPAARVGYAVSEMKLNHDGLALSVVLDGLARDPEHADLNELLGDLRDREERVEDALAAWKDAFRLSPNDRLREKILKGERELAVGRHYDRAATSHFNVRYDGDVDRTLAAELVEYLEQQYWELADRFAHAPPQPITVLLYPTREFRQVTYAPDWVGGLYDGKIRVPLAGLSRLDPRAENVLRHELAHAVIHSKTHGQCPRWLQEGLAQIIEGKQLRRSERQQVVAHLRAGPPETWESRGFSYPLALSLTRHLEQRRGLDLLVWLLELLGEGRSVDAALRDVYGLDYADLCRRWLEAEEAEVDR